MQRETFDSVIGDEGWLHNVLDAIFAFVGLFSPDGVVVDVNRVPLVASGLGREEVVGFDLPWFAHSAGSRGGPPGGKRRGLGLLQQG
jgi:PAS domain-containing protein